MKKTSSKKKNNNMAPRVAQSLLQAASLLGVPKSEVQRAKRCGAGCFLPSGRIRVARLRSWLKSHPVETKSHADLPHPELAGIDLAGLMMSLSSAAEVEGKNLELLRAAQARGDAVAAEAATAAFGRSQKNKLAIEVAVRKERQARGELLTVSQGKINQGKMWIPALTLMRQLPRTLAARVNHGDEVAAEKILAEGIESVISEMRRSVIGEPDPDFHLKVFQAHVLREKGAPALLLRLQEAVITLTNAMAEEANASPAPSKGQPSDS